MCKVIAVANQKGGCAKTTTTINVAASLVQLGKNVLCVDWDGQANLTQGLGYQYEDEFDGSIMDVVQDILDGKETTTETTTPYILTSHGIDFLPATLSLMNLELNLVNAMRREHILERLIEPLKAQYDYIFIDCNPTLSLTVINALTAADEVIIPIQGEFFNLKGMESLLETIAKVRNSINNKLKVGAILFTKVNPNHKHTKEAMNVVHETYGSHFFIANTHIPYSSKVSEKQSEGKPIVAWNNKENKVGPAYQMMTLELLERWEVA